jgi:carbon storage regulator CsrA
MLVLSRRLQEKVLFPGINTAIQVVAVKGTQVRLGIEAPPGLLIVREELHKGSAVPADPALSSMEGRQAGAESAESQFRALRHLVRNRLNVTSVGLGLLRQQARAGLTDELERTITMMEEEMQMLRQRLESAAVKVPPAPPTRRSRKALLVEDDQNERELLAGLLRLSGFDVDTAGDGCDALDHLQSRGRPDVVLLDMGLPRCDGPTTARAIRRNPDCAGLKIFAVTGHAPEEYDLTQGPGGIDRWFSKPIDPVTLLQEMSRELAP